MGMSQLDSTWLSIGGRRQFFFDDLMLEQVQDVTRRYYSPEKVSGEPLIQADQPWEHVTYFTCNAWNVIRDPADGLFKCWYEDWMIDDPKKAPTWVSEADGKLCVDFHSRWPSRVCYAQSKDGTHWEKPGLGIVRENGHNTNIVLGGEKMGLAHCAYVMLDMAESEPNKRFKAVFEHRRLSGGNDMAGEGSFRAATSADGINWNIIDKDLVFGQVGAILGDVVTITRDPETGVYWANNRHPQMCSLSVHDQRKPSQRSWISPIPLQKMAQDNRRRVFRSKSVDFFNWSTPQPLVVPDNEFDNIDDSFYGMEQFQVGDDWVGLLNVFHMTDNYVDVQLTYSRDGEHFRRVRPGCPWLKPGGEDFWDSTMALICSKPVVVGDELYVYYGGARNHHDWWIVGGVEGLDVPEAQDMGPVNYAMGLAKMKIDRFVSISSAQGREGLIVTPAFVPSGNKLLINARTRPGGMVRFAIADGQDRVFDGFGKDECVVFSGDKVAHQVMWKGKTGLPEGTFQKLHIYLKDADIFSFQFVE